MTTHSIRLSASGTSALDYHIMERDSLHDDEGAREAMNIKRMACFGSISHRHGICARLWSNRLQIALIIYHIFRFVLATYDYIFERDLCLPLELNVCALCLQHLNWSIQQPHPLHSRPFQVLLGKFSTFSIYCYGLYTLRKEDLFPLIAKSFHRISTTIWTVLFVAMSIPFCTGIIVAFTLNPSALYFHSVIFKFFVECSDILRYWPSTAVVLLLYGFLDTFSFKVEHSTTRDGRRDFSVVEMDNWNHVQFMKDFQRLTVKYRTVVSKFQWFLMVFLFDVLLLWALMVMSIVLDFFGMDCVYFAIEYTHYLTETMFYCLLWSLPIWKLHRCYEKLLSFKHDFIAKIGITERENMIQKLLIVQYLEVMTESRSPFRIAGVNPGKKTVRAIVISITLPVLVQLFKLMSGHFNWDLI